MIRDFLEKAEFNLHTENSSHPDFNFLLPFQTFTSKLCCSLFPETQVTFVCTQVFAEKEVILSGGAINSPQLLLLSGVGNADDLKQLDIPVVQHLPGTR